MRIKWIKPIVLFCVFVISLVVTNILTNHTNEDLTTTMAQATLPVITFEDHGIAVNELHGYCAKMDPSKMRDSIMPVKKDRKLELTISECKDGIDKVSYEIRSLDGKRLVADGKEEGFTRKEGKITLSIQLQNILEEGREYSLVLALEGKKDPVYYYTRLVETEECHTGECLDFALKFHEYSFRDDANDFIPTYMDPATGDTTTLQYVDLTCTLRQITWADFHGKVLGMVTASFKEINSSYNVILLQYVVASVNKRGETEYYNVEEYYRLRYTKARMYVLNFERNMNEIFRGENTFINEKTDIRLGIRDENVEYKSCGNVISFVQEGELWSYHIGDRTISRVFSFLGAEGIDKRENLDQHDIKIVRVDEAGSIDFIVYGYMNRGPHEGLVGMNVFHYDGLSKTVEEEAFLPMDCSYEILKAEMGQLMYENETDVICLMIEGTVYEIDLATLKIDAKIKNLSEGNYSISQSNRYFAWIDTEKQNVSETLHILDFKNNKQTDVKEDSFYLKPLGFVGDDLIYGAAKKQNVSKNTVGKIVFPMSYLKIMKLSDSGYEIAKEYQQKGKYIGGIDVREGTIEVSLLKENNGQLTAVSGDSIMNRAEEEKTKVSVKTIVTENKQREVVLQQSTQIEENADSKIITPRIVVSDGNKTINIKTNSLDNCYYVYKKGDVLLAASRLSDAIENAQEHCGTVVDQSQKTIWMRTGKSSQQAFAGLAALNTGQGNSYQRCLAVFIKKAGGDVTVSGIAGSKSKTIDILRNNLKNKQVLDLTGCKTESLIWYVSKGIPVLAMTDTKKAILITGYGGGRINYFDAETNRTNSMTYEKADKLFEKNGNIFFSYLE